MFTEISKKKLRKIDCVTVKGSIKPIELYTFDMNLIDIKSRYMERSNLSKKDKRLQKVISRIRRKHRFKKILAKQLIMNQIFENDNDFVTVRKNFDEVIYWNNI